jgi:hypothetical protein
VGAAELHKLHSISTHENELVARNLPVETAASSAVSILTLSLLTNPCRSSSALMASPVLPAARYPANEKVKPPPRITISEPRTQ